MLVSCLCAANLWAQSEVNVEQAGTLSTLLTSAGSMLKLTGTLNGTDIKYLRQLTTDGPVMSLDISGVRIVSGGEAYYESYRTENDVIGQYMFWKCGRLRNVVLPPTVTSIGRCAFAYTALRKAEVPGSVQRLGYGAFSDCPSLSTVLIGSHVAHIEQGAFYNSAVTLVYLKPLSPPSLGPYIFTSKPTLRVYTVALEEYQQSSWAQYGTFMGRLENLYPLEDDGSGRVNALRDTFFEDAACTRLRGEYQAMTDDELTAALSAAGMPDQADEHAVIDLQTDVVKRRMRESRSRIVYVTDMVQYDRHLRNSSSLHAQPGIAVFRIVRDFFSEPGGGLIGCRRFLRRELDLRKHQPFVGRLKQIELDFDRAGVHARLYARVLLQKFRIIGILVERQDAPHFADDVPVRLFKQMGIGLRVKRQVIFGVTDPVSVTFIRVVVVLISQEVLIPLPAHTNRGGNIQISLLDRDHDALPVILRNLVYQKLAFNFNPHIQSPVRWNVPCPYP